MWLWCVLGLLMGEHVQNPLSLEKSYQLTKDLTLGNEDSEEVFLFSATAHVVPLADGRFYVLDGGNFRILAFNPQGEQVGEFGRKGSGPGEFSEPVAAAMDPKNRIWVFDTGTHKAICFNGDGSFASEHRFSTSIHGIYSPAILPDGSVVMTTMRLGEGFAMSYEQIVLTNKGEVGRVIRKLGLRPVDFNKATNPSFWVGLLRDHLETIPRGWPLQAKTSDRVVTMHTAEYRGHFQHSVAPLSNSFEKAFKPVPASEEAKVALVEPLWQSLAANPAISENLGVAIFNRAVGEMEGMERLPPVSGLMSWREGFAVLSSYHPIKKSGSIDFFDPEGKLLASAPYQGTYQSLAGAGDFLYAVGPDEEDNIVIERYRVSR